MKKQLLSTLMAGCMLLALPVAAENQVEEHLYVDPVFIGKDLPPIRVDHPKTEDSNNYEQYYMPNTQSGDKKVANTMTVDQALEQVIPEKSEKQQSTANATFDSRPAVSNNEAGALEASAEHRLRTGAKLRIKVFGDEELSGEYTVRPDGKILFPLIGNVYCKNRTVDDVVKEMEARLDDGYLVDPRISIDITQLGSTRVYVMGEVRRPGMFELEKSNSLLDAIGAAGGFTEKAAKRKVYVSRRGMDDFVMKVNMLDLMKDGYNGANVELQEKDCVYITSNHKLGFARFMGHFYSVLSGWDKVDDMRKD